MLGTMCNDLTPLELRETKIVFEMINNKIIEIAEDLPRDIQQLTSEFVIRNETERESVLSEINEKLALYNALAEIYKDDEQMIEEIFRSEHVEVDPLLSLISDENAIDITNLFPEWAVGVMYPIGFRARYDGGLYSCNQLHTSQADWTPPSVPALWRQIGEPGVIPEWVQPTGAQDAYNTGDKVTHNDKTWESLVDANVWEPGTAGTESLWKEI